MRKMRRLMTGVIAALTTLSLGVTVVPAAADDHIGERTEGFLGEGVELSGSLIRSYADIMEMGSALESGARYLPASTPDFRLVPLMAEDCQGPGPASGAKTNTDAYREASTSDPAVPVETWLPGAQAILSEGFLSNTNNPYMKASQKPFTVFEESNALIGSIGLGYSPLCTDDLGSVVTRRETVASRVVPTNQESSEGRTSAIGIIEHQYYVGSALARGGQATFRDNGAGERITPGPATVSAKKWSIPRGTEFADRQLRIYACENNKIKKLSSAVSYGDLKKEYGCERADKMGVISMKKRLKAGRGEVTIDVPRASGTVLIVEDWLKVRAKRTRQANAPSDYAPDYLEQLLKERPEELAAEFAMREWLDSLTKDDMPTQWFMTRSTPISIVSRFGR